MRKLVRLLLVHYDRFGILALVGWLAFTVGTFSAAFLAAQKIVMALTNFDARQADSLASLVAAPIVIYVILPFWAAVLLVNERLWMFIGLYRLLHWEPYRFRKLVGRLAQESKAAEKE